MNKFIKSLISLIKFLNIKKEKRKIVFYTENESFYTFFSGIIDKLTNKYSLDIYYITSSKTDPLLHNGNSKIKSFYVGSETIKTIFFQLFNSQIMILTMPDLNTFHIKKSKYDVNYIFIPHNILSIHMVFRKKAFNYFDTFFCVGPHHNIEIKKTEEIYNLNKIQTFDFGYNKIDKLLIDQNKKKIDSHKQKKTLIIAPSWGKDCILEKNGNELLSLLMNKDWNVVIRPHPDTIRLDKNNYLKLKNKFKSFSNIKFEENISGMSSFYLADVMISDWSGVAFEFAFGLEKPVIFIDVPKKINNPDYDLYKIEAVEISLRKKIGKVINLKNLDNIYKVLEDVYENKEKYKSKIIKERSKHIYNLKNSSEKGAEFIYSLINK